MSYVCLEEFVGYLWGIETGERNWACKGSPRFVGYLWGIETEFASPFRLSHPWFVCRLPMRNWNETDFTRSLMLMLVCRLPMRNWNHDPYIKGDGFKSRFVGYLWGIETRASGKTPTALGWVCRLPMRNWNKYEVLQQRRIQTAFVGYLWGIETYGCSGWLLW